MLQISVGIPGPQPRAPDLSGHCWTPTAASRSQWALPDLSQTPERMSDRMPETIPEYMPESMAEWVPDRMPMYMPERMSDRTSEKMSSRNYVRIVFQVGDHSKKVIWR